MKRHGGPQPVLPPVRGHEKRESKDSLFSVGARAGARERR